MVMKLKLIREPSTPSSTFGVLFIDGFFECFTIENTSKIIDSGIYPLTKYFSPHNNTNVPLLQNVIGRSEIEIHVANYYTDLAGCIGVGDTITRPSLSNSRVAFNVLMSKLNWDNLSIQISYVNS